MAYTTLLFDLTDGIATVTVNRPDKLNALNATVIAELDEVAARIERGLPGAFALDSELIRVLVLDRKAYRQVITGAPAGFGDEPDTYRYDVGFYVGVGAAEVEPFLTVNPEVDEVTCGKRAFYHRRVAALASRSRLSKIVGTPVYASLTIRNWRTTVALAEMLDAG